MEEENLVNVAASNGSFKLLVAVINFLDANKSEDDLGLIETLTAEGADLTVFAPTDQAFANLAETLGDEGGRDVSDIADIEALTDFFVANVSVANLRAIVEYHVVAGAKDAGEIDALASLMTVGGGLIDLSRFDLVGESTELVDVDLSVVNPDVVIPNVLASNGIIHAIDNVLLPVDVQNDDNLLITAANNSNFQLLVAVIGLLDATRSADDPMLMLELSSPDADLTVFAPTDQAFANLAATLGYGGNSDVSTPEGIEALSTFFIEEVPIETLRAVVNYHIVEGAKDATTIDAADELVTKGGTIDLSNFDLAGGSTELIDVDLNVENPNVIIPNVLASNGIIHAIDNVLLPVDVNNDDLVNIVEKVIELSGDSGFDDNAGDFDMLREAVIAADLQGPLSELDVTVFAPTDDAFVGLSQTLGFEGSDEAGAFGYLVDALRLLNAGNDPIELLSTVLTYHVSPGGKLLEEVAITDPIQTLQGGTLSVNGISLVDADPDITDPSLVATDVLASNGVIHAIDGVLLPVDLLVSDGSNDVDFIIADDGRDHINTGKDNDFVDARGGRDVVISGQGNDVVLAGDGRDFVNAGKGDDIVKGEGGADRIIAGSGNDFVDGGDGRDWISGGKGNDTIAGGEGDDWLSGGFGKDTFVFEENGGHDTIKFFWKGQDKIDLTAYEFESFDDLESHIDRKFFRTEIDLGDTEITVNTFFFGLTADDFIL